MSSGAAEARPAAPLRRVHDAARAAGRAPLIVVDGPSGSGKSTLADALARSWPGGLDLVRLDDVYPGWGGLERAAAELGRELLAPRAAGRAGGWTRWDWAAGRPAERHRVLPGRALVLEGCGAFAAAGALPAVRVWIAAPDAARKRRALERDAGAFDAHWDDWERQWRRHVARHGGDRRATLRLGAPPDA